MTDAATFTSAGDGSGTRVVVVLAPRQAPQQTEAQIRDQIHQSAAEIRRQALENAQAQLEAQRAKLEAQRASIEAQRNGQGGLEIPAPPAPPAAPGLPSGSHGISISRDGQVIAGAGGGAASATFAQTGDPNLVLHPEIPPGAVTLGLAFFIMLAFIAVGLPLARAWARRMDRQSSAPAPYPLDVTDRLERIEHAVEAVAIEVERISEGQRFTTKLLTDRGEPAPAARPDDFAGGGR